MKGNYLTGLLVAAFVAAACQKVACQGTKSISSSSRLQQFAPQQQQVSSQQLSSTFLQMFNQLTPSQQRQFINQMSSSNRRFFQQQMQIQQPQSSSLFSSEEFSSNQALPSPVGGTKSASSFKRTSSSQVSPAVQQQLQNFLRTQEESFSSQQLPQSRPQKTNIQSSRQISFNQIQPVQQVRDEFESSRLVQQQQFQQPSQQAYFQQLQEQLSKQGSLGATKGGGSVNSFRRVQNFFSQPQPQPIVNNVNSFTQQQFSSSQQQQPEPQPASFSRFERQQQFSSSGLPATTSSSSSLAGNALTGSDVSGFSAALQQEKVDSGNFQQGFESTSSSGFESNDVQQRNLQIPEDFSGLTAASINNRWYIMRPVENPSALGLGDAKTSSSSNVRQVPLSQVQATNALLDLTSSSTAIKSKQQVADLASSKKLSTTNKRSTASEVRLARSQEESDNEVVAAHSSR